MEGHRKNWLSASYNRLHGATSSTGSTNAPSVHFNDQVNVKSFLDDNTRMRRGETSLRNYESKDDIKMVTKYNFENYSNKKLNRDDLNYGVPMPSHDHNEHNQRLFSLGITIAGGLSNFFVIYPCVVLRRQCQINHIGRRYHLTPITLSAVAFNLQRSQGISCLWKGFGSSLGVKAIEVSCEALISESSKGRLPKELPTRFTLSSLGGHLALKTIVAVIVNPFYSAHLIESVQSEMTSEIPGLFSFLRNGLVKMFGFGKIQNQRLIPFYKLLFPSVLNSISRYVVYIILQQVIIEMMKMAKERQHRKKIQYHQEQLTSDNNSTVQSLLESNYIELSAVFLAELICDVAFYPTETILNRLYIQGTRTIIDNTDSGRGFLPVNLKYEGFFDCFHTITATEGYAGLYRGFGAMILQHGLKYGILKITQFALKLI